MLWSFGQVCATMLHQRMYTSSIFNSQHVVTHLATGWPNAATCCAQQCWDILRRNFAIVWPALESTGPTMLKITICCVKLLRSFGRGLRPLRGEKLNYKSVAKEISKPPFLASEVQCRGIRVYRVCSIHVSFKCFEPRPDLVCHVTTIENV